MNKERFEAWLSTLKNGSEGLRYLDLYLRMEISVKRRKILLHNLGIWYGDGGEFFVEKHWKVPKYDLLRPCSIVNIDGCNHCPETSGNVKPKTPL